MASVAVFGQIGPFDPTVEDWTQYSERLELFMDANAIQASAKRKKVFLATIGATAYKLLRNLVSPMKPADVELDVLKDKLQQHYSPKPSEIVQRFKFNTLLRKPGESVAHFLSQLRALAEFCNYGDTLDTMLRDRFVCGIENQVMQRKLLAEADLTLKKAVDIALSIEAAEKDARFLGETSTPLQPVTQKVHKVKSSSVNARPKPTTSASICYRCGGEDHSAQQCKFSYITML